jgi:hypothetical protein
MAILRFPINIADSRAVRERTAQPPAGMKPVEPIIELGMAGVMGRARESRAAGRSGQPASSRLAFKLLAGVTVSLFLSMRIRLKFNHLSESAADRH